MDLHVHSTASDGTYTPVELLRMAEEAGLRAIAITDHDTIAGSRQAFAADLPENLELLSGVEISVQPPPAWADSGGLHILGYGIDLDHAGLGQAMDDLLHVRNNRIPMILDKLKDCGINLSLEQVRDEAGQGVPGRPHVALAMIKSGVVESIDAAFDLFLSKGKPAYVDKYRMNCRQAFDLIHSAGGLPVLAHPFLIPDCREGGLAGMLRTLQPMGLMGVEAYYPNHPAPFREQVLALAENLGLLITGGTDFHGDLNPEIKLGCGLGDLHVPSALYDTLLETCQRRNA